MLLNTIGETVTRLFNVAMKQCDSSWLTQLLLMLRSHVTVLHTLCAVICHLVTRQANSLSDCHVHALAAILVHWNYHADCSAGIRVQRASTDGAEAEVTRTMPIVPYVLESLPLSTTADMSFSLLFAVSFVIYAKMIGRDSFTDETQTSSDGGLETRLSLDERAIIPDYVRQLLSYLGPRLVKDLRAQSSDLPRKESVVSSRFSSVERFLSDDSVRSSLRQSRMSFESWIRKEIEVADDDGLSPEWLCEYYNWVVFTGWHKPQSIADSATSRTYFVGVLQVLAQTVLDFDTRSSQRRTCCCPHNRTLQYHRLKQTGRHNIFSFLQASGLFSVITVLVVITP